MGNYTQTIQSFMKQQKELGVKRKEIANALFAKGFSEVQVGTLMGVHPKTAHAMKVDFSKYGKSIQAVTGVRQHLDPEVSGKLKGGIESINKFIHAAIGKVGHACHTKVAQQ